MSIGKMLNPLQHIKDTVNSVKSLAHGDIMGALDPAHALSALGGMAGGGAAGGGGGGFGPYTAPTMPGAATNPYQLPSGQNLSASMFPSTGFSSPAAQQYLMQILGPGFAPPQGGQQGQMGFTDGQTGQQPGPSQNPFSQLAQYSGPMGNGGGYLTGVPQATAPLGAGASRKKASGWAAKK